MELSKEDKKKREELRLKMVEHQERAGEYRDQVSLIDDKTREEYIKSIVGKCYKIRSGYLRVDKYLKKAMTFMGVEIHIFGEDEYCTHKIELNSRIFQDDIDEGEEISSEEFSKKLKHIITLIK